MQGLRSTEFFFLNFFLSVSFLYSNYQNIYIGAYLLKRIYSYNKSSWRIVRCQKHAQQYIDLNGRLQLQHGQSVFNIVFCLVSKWCKKKIVHNWTAAKESERERNAFLIHPCTLIRRKRNICFPFHLLHAYWLVVSCSSCSFCCCCFLSSTSSSSAYYVLLCRQTTGQQHILQNIPQ